MTALSVHLLALALSFVPVPVVQPAADYYAAAPASEFLGRAVVVMNTDYGDPAVANYKKKNKQSGRSNLLKGYTVGSRAPSTAVRSGTNAINGYGINNLYGKNADSTLNGLRKNVVIRVGYRESLQVGEGGSGNRLLGGAGARAKKTALNPKGLGPIFCWVGLIIFVGSYFKFAA
jgi:hypothetical protein